MKRLLHVLIVEDSEDDAWLLVRELKKGGYQITQQRVETAEAFKEALAREAWEVVLCDFTLPRFSGPMALQIIQQTDPDMPFIYVSGTIGEEAAVEAMKAGAHDYVMKDNLNRLVPAVERELRQGRVRRERRQFEVDRQKLIEDLQAALVEVKRLSGLLPICAGCKRIRNEHGEWQEIEAYIQEHTQAQFSHGLCQECVNRFYADLQIDCATYEQTTARLDR